MESILQLYQLAMMVLPVYGYVSLRKEVRRREILKRKALLRYASMVFLPMPAYVAAYFLAIGVESATNWNLVSEEMARSFPLAIALGLMVWLLSVMIFSVAMCFVRGATMAPPKP